MIKTSICGLCVLRCLVKSKFIYYSTRIYSTSTDDLIVWNSMAYLWHPIFIPSTLIIGTNEHHKSLIHWKYPQPWAPVICLYTSTVNWKSIGHIIDSDARYIVRVWKQCGLISIIHLLCVMLTRTRMGSTSNYWVAVSHVTHSRLGHQFTAREDWQFVVFKLMQSNCYCELNRSIFSHFPSERFAAIQRCERSNNNVKCSE